MVQVEANLRLKIELGAQKLYWQSLMERVKRLDTQARRFTASAPAVPPVSVPVNAEPIPVASAELEDLRRQLAERNRLYTAESIRVNELTSRLEASERARAEAEKDKASALLNIDQQPFAYNIRISELTSQLTASQKACAQAEQDKECFLNLYHQSSAYVSTVRDENFKLLERAEIAEGQAKYDFEMAKAAFRKTSEKLKKDIGHYRRVAEFLIERNHRSSEGIRSRAAEELRLKMQIGVLQQQLRRLTKEVSETREKIEEEREERSVCVREKRKNEEVLTKWKEETFRVNVELNESLALLANVHVVGTGGLANETVCRCHWRAENEEKCNEVFLTNEVSVSRTQSLSGCSYCLP
jgi:hypothetical protein